MLLIELKNKPGLTDHIEIVDEYLARHELSIMFVWNRKKFVVSSVYKEEGLRAVFPVLRLKKERKNVEWLYAYLPSDQDLKDVYHDERNRKK